MCLELAARGWLRRVFGAALLALSMSACASLPGNECNAPPDPGKNQVVVGYGSLMQDESRTRTSPRAGKAVPVELAGFRRGWFSHSAGVGLGTTYLGVVPDEGARLNAVAYRVDNAELAATDRRESSYCRLPVARSAIRPLAGDATVGPDDQVWIYAVTTEAATPTERFPIVQSYVDIFLSGCLEQEERFGVAGFSAQCVRTTDGWSENWVNDRIFPRRPFAFQPRAPQIDRLLSAEVAKFWSHMRIEGL